MAGWLGLAMILCVPSAAWARPAARTYLPQCGTYRILGKLDCEDPGRCRIRVHAESLAETWIGIENATRAFPAFHGALVDLRVQVRSLAEPEAIARALDRGPRLGRRGDDQEPLRLEKAEPCARK